MAEIHISGARKVYAGGTEAIPGLSLEIEDGQLCVLVGPSGCGKSTLLRMVAGLEEATAGEIRIGGRVVNDLEPAERDIAMVFQNYALYPHMSVFDNMAYGLRNRGQKRDEIRRRVDEAAAILGLDGLLDRKPRQLSGGQRQRVAMGRAIVRQPQAFLFDEPLSNLDAKLRMRTRVEIRDLQQRLGTTSIYVTHDQLEAMTMADKLVVMNAGRIEQVGAPLEVYERPVSVFVAGFIGAPPMNFLSGRVADGEIRLADGARLGRTSAPDDPDVVIGVRPEALEPREDGPLRARVRVVEPLGATINVHARIEGERDEIVASLSGVPSPRPGDALSLAPAEGELHLFDRASGRRID